MEISPSDHPHPPRFISLSAMARSQDVSTKTARSRLVRAGILPDAFLMPTVDAIPIPIFEMSNAVHLLPVVAKKSQRISK